MHGDVNQQNNIGCSSCEECNVRIIEESTPLLRGDVTRSKVNCCIIFLLSTIFLIGVTVGVYLLVEDIEWESEQPFSAMKFFGHEDKHNFSQYANPTDKVRLVEYQLCDNISRCEQRTNQLTKNNSIATDIDGFNFFVNANATVYKHLGFDNYCSNCDNGTLVIALSRTDHFSSSDNQKYKVEEIIDYGVSNNKLLPCSEVSVANDVDWLQILGENLQIDIDQRYNCTN